MTAYTRAQAATAMDDDVLDELKTLLRRDLRLGPDAPISGDMPLVGGPIDLDSIDILLVVSSIEKQFGIKVPSEAIGRAAFESVATLAHYVRANRETLRVADGPAAGAAAPADHLAQLPHGPEFRFVSAVSHVEPGVAAAGVWNVTGAEDFLRGHFPGRPLVPGVLVTEALAQLAGLAAARAGDRAALLAHVDVRFLAPIAPPASIELRASVAASTDALRRCDVVASVGGHAVARGGVALSFEEVRR